MKTLKKIADAVLMGAALTVALTLAGVPVAAFAGLPLVASPLLGIGMLVLASQC